MVFGDFNEILHMAKKQGGRNRSEKQMTDFREVLTSCDLRDMGYVCSPFTWCNNTEGSHRIYERLDWFLANSHQCDFFSFGSMCHGQAAYSNHYSIQFDTRGNQHERVGPKLFRFEAIWVKEDQCTNIIEDIWALSTVDGSLGNIMNLIKHCGFNLSWWNKTCFGNVQQYLVKANNNLKNAQERHLIVFNNDIINQARK